MVTAIRRLLAPLDITVSRLSKTDAVETASRRARFVDQEGITIVLDVGADVGLYGLSLRDHGYSGRIESFEPRPSAYESLRQRPWSTHRAAVGADTGSVRFNVSENAVSSSPLPMLETHLTSAPASRVTDVIEVEVVTLDSMDLVKDTDRVLLKIDVQGYEGAVLEGASETLVRTRMIEMELSLVPLYEGQMLYRDAIDRLHDLGFELIWIARGLQHPANGRLLQIDGIFART